MCAKADRRILGDAERAAEIEIALGATRGRLQRNVERGRHRFQRHAGAGDQRLEQHVAGAELEPEPPVAGCSPATASARPVSTLQAMPSSSSEPLAFSVITAASGSPCSAP